MIWALVKKELKDLFPFALALGVALLLMVGGLTGNEQVRQLPVLSDLGLIPNPVKCIPFLGGGGIQDFPSYFTILSSFFIILFASRQALWESLRGTKLFLYHRPISRNTILLTKMFTGIGLYWALGLGAILLYGGWASNYWGLGQVSIPVFDGMVTSAGNIPAPFEWSMTDRTFRILLCAPVLYLGAFMAMSAPGFWRKWFLLFPILVAGGLLAALLEVPRWWTLGLVSWAASMVLLVKANLDIERATDVG